MELPIDIKALIEEVANISAANDTAVSVSVYIDNKAPADVTAHVRSIFASASQTVRMTLSYLDNTFMPHEGDDIAVIVAGESRTIGAAAAVLRAAGIPTAIGTTLPDTVDRIASAGKHPIPHGDIVSPFEDADDKGGKPVDRVEPVELTEDLAALLDDRLARWIVSVSADKRLAFGIAFPFMRRSLAVESVKATSLQNAGIGLAPFIPGADLPIMTLNQAKMILQIAAAYGHTLNKERGLELASVVGSAYVSRTLARKLLELIPGLGIVIRPGIAYGGTAAVGYAAIGYFEEGKDVGGVVKVVSGALKKAKKTAIEVREDPQAAIATVRTKAAEVVPAAREKVDEYVPVAYDAVAEYAPKVKEAVLEYVPAVKNAFKDIASSVKAEVTATAR